MSEFTGQVAKSKGEPAMRKALSVALYLSLLTGPVAFVRSEIHAPAKHTFDSQTGGDPCDGQITQIVYGILCGQLDVCIAPCTGD